MRNTIEIISLSNILLPMLDFLWKDILLPLELKNSLSQYDLQTATPWAQEVKLDV